MAAYAVLAARAVRVALRCKEEVAKILVLILIIFIFVYLGFEHSIANMGTFSLAILGGGKIGEKDATELRGLGLLSGEQGCGNGAIRVAVRARLSQGRPCSWHPHSRKILRPA